MSTYHYKACGLDNVILEGVDMVQDDAGEKTVTIQAVGRLHKVIAAMVVQKPHALNGKELRFLRTEMGMTQAELANILRCESLTISRWERDENPINEAADALVRLLAEETLKLDITLSVTQVSGWTTASATNSLFRIDGSNPKDYQPLAA
jgi:transcriptional regulator with XRE-family HTH domain